MSEQPNIPFTEIMPTLPNLDEPLEASPSERASTYVDITPSLAGLLAPVNIENGALSDKFDRSFVSERSEAEAAEVILQAESSDQEVDIIIKHYAPKTPSTDIPKLIRDNGEFRLALGAYLQHKVRELSKQPNGMPYRVAVNGRKSSNTPGYPSNMLSQEYAIALAVSMLDGTFKPENEDEVFYDSGNNEGGGQHRVAARRLLLSPKVVSS